MRKSRLNISDALAEAKGLSESAELGVGDVEAWSRARRESLVPKLVIRDKLWKW